TCALPIYPDWELTLGGRHEFWKSREGFFETSQLSLKQPERDISKFSPKFSLGWEPADRLRLQYSLALAHRFPVPEELFDFEFRTFGRSEEHTSELQSRENLVCRLLLEKQQ